MKKIFSILLVVTVLLVVTGCGKEDFEVTNNGVTSRIEERVVKGISDVDEQRGNYVLLGIEEVKLTESGKLYIETDDALKSLGNDVLIASDVKEIYLLPFGNAGYRSLIFIKNDNTVSALNTTELITNKKVLVMDNLGGYTNVKSVKSVKGDNIMLVHVTLENGEIYPLDEYLN